MTNYIKRLLWVDQDETIRVNPLVYAFIWVAFFYGFGFVALGHWSGVASSSLFQAMSDVHVWLPSIWGACSLISSLLAFFVLFFRKGEWGELASMFGIVVWIFALIIYLINGFWLPLFTVTIPSLFFWIFYFFRVKWYERQKAAGLIDAGTDDEFRPKLS